MEDLRSIPCLYFNPAAFTTSHPVLRGSQLKSAEAAVEPVETTHISCNLHSLPERLGVRWIHWPQLLSGLLIAED